MREEADLSNGEADVDEAVEEEDHAVAEQESALPHKEHAVVDIVQDDAESVPHTEPEQGRIVFSLIDSSKSVFCGKVS